MERKTLDQRAQMTDLERLRHSAAHVMATAIAKLWPDAQFAAGPPVEDGFYYDVELQHRITPEDFPAIEAEMKKISKENQVFEKVVVTREQALADAQSGRLAALAPRGARAARRPLCASANACSRVTMTFSKTWFSFETFFISASMAGKSSGEMRCCNSTS